MRISDTSATGSISLYLKHLIGSSNTRTNHISTIGVTDYCIHKLIRVYCIDIVFVLKLLVTLLVVIEYYCFITIGRKGKLSI